MRLDKYLALKYPHYSRHYFQYLIKKSLVLLNGKKAKKASSYEEGDELEVEFALTPEISLEPEPIPLEILYEDEDLIAINKPSGMVVHPAVGNWKGTFVNALLYHCQTLEKGDSLRPGIVHRLDKETTGVLIACKNLKAQQLMIEKFANQQIKKEYLALCLGNPGNRIIAGNIGRHPTRRKEMTILENGGRRARTRCESLNHNTSFALVRLFPETGRTHQLRVHLKSIGTPVLGDPLYGSSCINKKLGIHRQQLHAHRLFFTHPLHHKEIELEAPLPQDMKTFIKIFPNN